MGDHKYTIIIITGSKADVRKIRISLRFFLFALFAVVTLFLGSIGTTIHYFSQHRQAQTIQRENAKLRSDLKEAEVVSIRLARRLYTLNNLSAKLKAIAGISEADIRKYSSKPGIGGVSIEGSRDPQKLPEIQLRAESLQKSLILLQSYFRDRRSQPSMLPSEGFVSSGFGMRRNPFTNMPDFHEGIDIQNDLGTPVVAPADGTVIFAGGRGSFGQVVEIRHEGGIVTVYGHLHQVLVTVGQRIIRWQQIGLMGNSGKSTGPHLHYEVHVRRQAVNPITYLNSLEG